MLQDLEIPLSESVIRDFFKPIKEELICGQSEFLEVEGPGMKPLTFEISLFE